MPELRYPDKLSTSWPPTLTESCFTGTAAVVRHSARRIQETGARACPVKSLGELPGCLLSISSEREIRQLLLPTFLAGHPGSLSKGPPQSVGTLGRFLNVQYSYLSTADKKCQDLFSGFCPRTVLADFSARCRGRKCQRSGQNPCLRHSGRPKRR